MPNQITPTSPEILTTSQMQFNRRHFHTTVELTALKLTNTYAVFERGYWHSRGPSNSVDNIWVCVHQSEMSLNTWYLFIVSIKLLLWWTGSFWRIKIKSGIENPSKSEVIGRCGGDGKPDWPRRTDKSRTLIFLIKLLWWWTSYCHLLCHQWGAL